MPPEPLSWDRKDFLRERKPERSESFGYVGRWRDSSHDARDFNRWGSGEIRRLPGHGRQRGWHMFSEEPDHRYCPPWTSGHKMLEEERATPSAWRGDGKYGRNGRENRSFNPRDWRSHSWETSNGHRNSTGRSQYDMVGDHKSANGIVTYSSHSQSCYGNTSTENKPKEWHYKIRDANGLSAGQKCDWENSLDTSDWKPMKWTHTASLSSRGSGFNDTSSIKSLEISDTKAKSESLLKNGSLIRPPTPDLVVCSLSSPPSEDNTNSRKKPRLGWGEGLAKYEKKKIEDPSTGATSHSCGISLTEKYPVAGFSDCLSPASSSVACSSSPVVDEKSFGTTSGADGNLCSAGQGSQAELGGFLFIVERIKELDTSSFATLGSSLTELLQSNDLSYGASDYVKSAAINKLLLCKSESAKELEVTESEIDSLENELKSLISGTGDSPSSSPPSAIPLPLETTEEYSEPRKVVCSSIVQSEPLETVEEIAGEDDNSHSIAPSELVRPLSQVNSADDLMENEAGEVGVDTCRDSILDSNQEQARRASEVFNQLLAGCENKDRSISFSLLNSNELVEEKFARRKKFLKFQERVLGLNFNALQQSWKETHMGSTRKSRSRPHKLSSRTSNSVHQKHRPSACSRFSSPGNVSSGARAEIVDYAGKLLSETRGKACRDTLKMPALILDKKERMASKFSSGNGLVEDPCAFEKERSRINPWTPAEREIFVDKLALFGKDFGKIASFLDQKTTADCVEFYYKNHKSSDFHKTKNKLENSKNEESVSSMYLVTKGKKQNRELDSAYLDMLGAASEMVVAYENDKSRLRENFGSKDDSVSDRQTMSLDFTGNEREAVAADVLAGIGGFLSSEAMDSCITSSIEPASGHKKLKRKKVRSVVKKQLPRGILLQADDETWSDESCGELGPFDWTDEEKSIFVQAVLTYGKDFVMVSKCVRTKSRDQCSVFFSKARKCLGLDLIQTASGNLGTSVSGDDGNGGSGIEDACILESGSFTSGDKFCSKMDEDSRQSAANAGDGDSSLPEASLTDQWRSGENCQLSTLNHRDERISGFDIGKEMDKSLTVDDEKVGVEEPEGGLGESVAQICSESSGCVFGEKKNVDTDTTHHTELPCLVLASRDNGNLLADPSKDHPCIISLPRQKSSEKDGYGKDESNQHSIKRVVSSTVPNGNSQKATSNKMDGDFYLKRCTKPQSTGDELSFQLDKHEVMCKASKKIGNVKLFGKILNHSASLQNSNVRQNENEETANLRSKSELGENDHMAAGNLGFRKFDQLH